MGLMIKALRKKLHISQAEFAGSVGVSVRTIGSWERGESLPNAEQVWNCAVALGCTPNDVLGWNAANPRDPGGDVLDLEEREIVECYRESTPQWKQNISMTARAAAGESKESAKVGLSAAEERKAMQS